MAFAAFVNLAHTKAVKTWLNNLLVFSLNRNVINVASFLALNYSLNVFQAVVPELKFFLLTVGAGKRLFLTLLGVFGLVEEQIHYLIKVHHVAKFKECELHMETEMGY